TYMRDNIHRSSIPHAYGMRNTVKRRMLLTPLTENSPKLWRFLILLLEFTWAVISVALTGILTRRRTLIVSRDAKALLPAIIVRKLLAWIFSAKVIYIASEVKDAPIFKWVVKNSDGVMAGVTTTRKRIQELVKLPDSRFMLSLAPVPEPVVQCSKEEARKTIGYSEKQPLVVYTGKLGMDVHELMYIFEAAALLPDYKFLFTGGRASAVAAVRKHCADAGIENVMFTGFMNDSTQVRYYQLAADVLVSYYTAKDHLVEFNYPQKVNEYLTTGNPVVTPDFPATRDVLNDTNVIFVRPDDPMDLARGIRLAVVDDRLAANITRQAKEDMKELTFEKRTAEFLRFAETC
ncbi:MAG: glycosyltransferase, partial [Bacteroidota bacterium]